MRSVQRAGWSASTWMRTTWRSPLGRRRRCPQCGMILCDWDRERACAALTTTWLGAKYENEELGGKGGSCRAALDGRARCAPRVRTARRRTRTLVGQTVKCSDPPECSVLRTNPNGRIMVGASLWDDTGHRRLAGARQLLHSHCHTSTRSWDSKPLFRRASAIRGTLTTIAPRGTSCGARE